MKETEDHEKRLVESNTFLKKKKKVYQSISNKKYSIILLLKELDKLHDSVNFQNWIYHFKGPFH